MHLSALTSTKLYWANVTTPHGECIVVASEKGVCWASTPGSTVENAIAWAKRYLNTENIEYKPDFPILKKTMKELADYFAGKKVNFSGPFDMHGTEFQKKVWLELSNIPYGKTKTYGEVAALAGNPKAARAVGLANNRNPIAILIPCHRVVGSTGKLVGYAGGMHVKEWLLGLEIKGT